MIEKINIESFGTFKDFKWTKNVDSILGRLNIIYGRNYSGKTTLSRIFRSIEQKELHSDFKDGKFTIDISNKKSLTHLELENSDLKVRVYNSDFKSENLSFLLNKNGDILPFAILGEQNVETEKQILSKIKQLESYKISVYGDKHQVGLKAEAINAKNELTNIKTSLDDKLRMRARNIKRNPKLFQMGAKGDYNIRDIKAELELAKKLPDDELNKLDLILNEESKKTIKVLPKLKYKLDDYIKQCSNLVSKTISPSEPITFLLDNPDLQEWVRQGIIHHKDKRDRCAFCNSELTSLVWNKLEEHFTKEAEIHKKSVNNLIEEIENHKKEIVSKFIYSKNDLYVEFQHDYEMKVEELLKLEKKYLDDLDHLLIKLRLRSANIYNEYCIKENLINKSQNEIDQCISIINDIIQENNEYSNGISDRKNNTLKKLRLNDIKKFVDEIGYYEELEKIKVQNNICIQKDKEMREVENHIHELERNITHLKTLLSDELKAAEKVNEYLSVDLGHPELVLEVHQSEPNSTFVIKRDGDIAYNLSEGEQTLISFSYFLATLKDIPKSEKRGYTIFIDDPICSLDGSNIFYIFSLIDSEIVKDEYEQVFISTHNLDFFKYLRRVGKK
ncbi:AAA family ATPase [Exiguobacterium chiriqhucha]|uniref:AAA family ATPase n=1 Tax=Exiguobacterium chiriqhucha TaxID=1385984 RepID=UPI0007371618|nr:AAA family ATPase [Exiguobacterium chiriqhucha]